LPWQAQEMREAGTCVVDGERREARKRDGAQRGGVVAAEAPRLFYSIAAVEMLMRSGGIRTTRRVGDAVRKSCLSPVVMHKNAS